MSNYILIYIVGENLQMWARAGRARNHTILLGIIWELPECW